MELCNNGKRCVGVLEENRANGTNRSDKANRANKTNKGRAIVSPC